MERECGPGADADTQLTRIFQLTLSRQPSPGELHTLREFLTSPAAHIPLPPPHSLSPPNIQSPDPSREFSAQRPLAWVGRALFNTDNFITRE